MIPSGVVELSVFFGKRVISDGKENGNRSRLPVIPKVFNSSPQDVSKVP